MRVNRPQFTIRRLIIVVAVFAVCFALLRSPIGLLVAYLLLFLPGFLISRAHGGSGILAGALSESAFSAVLSIGWNSWHAARRASPLVEAITTLASNVLEAATVGFILGLVLSLILGLIIEITKALWRAFHV